MKGLISASLAGFTHSIGGGRVHAASRTVVSQVKMGPKIGPWHSETVIMQIAIITVNGSVEDRGRVSRLSFPCTCTCARVGGVGEGGRLRCRAVGLFGLFRR